MYGPFENKGNLDMSLYKEQEGKFQEAQQIGVFYGGTIVLRHWWADVVQGQLIARLKIPPFMQ
ncbi:hypothetical protein KUH03_10045 [Sphingobacterium sp. E70]|uniref:hypothetical protein n=1 Tax=Sphingobacterium sp. E70 TaxID=2853439 RepID=UPI00211BABDD|nr:hypothetical protein [Sphingobacterium sp. E70]ULT27080.1 hypothetical protein KUH03_10045 [Sphingobacterium sp. E70]